MAYTYNWQDNGLIRKFSDEISAADILRSNVELYESPRFSKLKYIINDFTAVTGYTVEKEHTKIYASTDDIISTTKGALKIAIIAVEPGHLALANNYRGEMKNKLFECEIFSNTSDALLWVRK